MGGLGGRDGKGKSLGFRRLLQLLQRRSLLGLGSVMLIGEMEEGKGGKGDTGFCSGNWRRSRRRFVWV